MHALPGIVDGARKASQGGKWALGDARGRRRGLCSLPMLEAIISRKQCMRAVTSVVHHSGRGIKAGRKNNKIWEQNK